MKKRRRKNCGPSDCRANMSAYAGDALLQNFSCKNLLHLGMITRGVGFRVLEF